MIHGDITGYKIGRKPVLETIKNFPNQIEIVYIQEKIISFSPIITLCKERKVKFKLVNKKELDTILLTNHQGLIAKVFSQGFADFDELLVNAKKAHLPIIIALDQVQDSGNVGTIARTLYALGGGGIIVPKDRSAHLGERAIKSSAGALDRLPISQVVNLSRGLEDCMEAGFKVYGTGLGENSASVFSVEFEFPAVLVLGGEDKGVRPGVLKRCDHVISIPMNNFDSINVAQAGAIVLGEMLRQNNNLLK